MRPAWAGVARWAPARSTEPSPFRLSPSLGVPGSFGEVTPTPYVCTKAARAVAVVCAVGLSLIALPFAGPCLPTSGTRLAVRLLNAVDLSDTLLGVLFGVACNG